MSIEKYQQYDLLAEELLLSVSLPKHFTIWYNWSISESPGNRGSPVNISIIRQPQAQTSTGLYRIK